MGDSEIFFFPYSFKRKIIYLLNHFKGFSFFRLSHKFIFRTGKSDSSREMTAMERHGCNMFFFIRRHNIFIFKICSLQHSNTQHNQNTSIKQKPTKNSYQPRSVRIKFCELLLYNIVFCINCLSVV